MKNLQVSKRRLLAAPFAMLFLCLSVTGVSATHPYVALDLHLFVDVSEPVAQKRSDEMEPFQDTLRAVWKELGHRADALIPGHLPDYIRIFVFADKVAEAAYWGGTLKDPPAKEQFERLLSFLMRTRSDEAVPWGLNRYKTDFEPVFDRLRSRPDEGQRHPVALIVSNGIHDTTASRNRCVARYESSDAERRHLQSLIDQLRIRTALLVTPCSIKGRESFFPFVHVWNDVSLGNFAVFLSHDPHHASFNDPATNAEAVVRYLRKDVVFGVPVAPVRIFGPAPMHWRLLVDAHRSLDLIMCPKEIRARDKKNTALIISRDVALRIPNNTAQADGCWTAGILKGQHKLDVELSFMGETIRDLLHETLERTVRIEWRDADRHLIPESLNLAFDWGAPCHFTIPWWGSLCFVRAFISPMLATVMLTLFVMAVTALVLAGLHASFGFLPWGWRLSCRVYRAGATRAESLTEDWRAHSGASFNGFRISPAEVVISAGGKWRESETKLKRGDAIRVWPFTSDHAAIVAAAGSSIKRLTKPAAYDPLVNAVTLDVRHREVVTVLTCGDAALWIWASSNSKEESPRNTGIGITLKWEKQRGVWGIVKRLVAVRSATTIYGCVHAAFWLCLLYFGLAFAVCKYYGVLEYWDPWPSIWTVIKYGLLIVVPVHFTRIHAIRHRWGDFQKVLLDLSTKLPPKRDVPKA